MEEKRNLEGLGVAMLLLISVGLGLNHVIIKLVNDGLQPVFAAGLRSVGAAFCVWLWMRFRGQRLDFRAGTIGAGLAIGVVFSIEFLGLFIALDLTTVTRTSVIFYSMPVWTAIMAHFLLPGERLTPVKLAGLALAMGGVVWAIADRDAGVPGTANIWGDLAALMGALGWMGVAILARVTSLNRVSPEMQMFWQLFISGPILLFAALFFGPFIRDLVPLHWVGLGYQTVVIAAAAFLAWFWLLNRYKASAIASFAFLTPIISVGLGWLVLDEPMSASIALKLALVAGGIVLINRPPKRQVARPHPAE
ncbi:DMT family transporter [Maritimibacter sp. DP1N21-5]|nr:DMT family transporter [Maritimibacter sp. DP1N21-5]MBV7409496.1 DMT family transporter [Maritimibacter sp. DP1N21-5]